MSLPELIEVVPLEKRVSAQITVPGSKSITNRALILAALAEGETVLSGALWSEDTQAMVECLQELGFMVNVTPEPREFCNRTITIYGKGGAVPSGGSEEQPLELFVGNAGTAARFLSAFVCLSKGVYRLHGVARMHERPQAALFQALRQLGYRIDAPNNRLPALIHGAGPRAGKCEVSIEKSSQFASALFLCGRIGQWQVTVTGEDSEQAAYVAMTRKVIEAFPKSGGRFQIEPDASSGSYFLAAERLAPGRKSTEYSGRLGAGVPVAGESAITVADWPASGWQIDEQFPLVLPRMNSDRPPGNRMTTGEEVPAASAKPMRTEAISRARDLGDSIMTAIVLAPFSTEPVRFTDLGRLRLQECERVIALRTELTKCGAKVTEVGDTLEVFPSTLHGAEIETYNDHRMAMCFAILGLKVPGMKIKNPACVKKTFPNFFQRLAGSPPAGLGATVLDGRGRALGFEELFAD
jgi:3-phosphoshikimate 1-carboxyvinyltransferase